jgi:DNA adenine methylase
MFMREPQRPVLRYFGGKWLLAPWIISHFPPHQIYVEPFGGGGSVLMRKARSYGEIYNDLDSTVVNVFRMLQKHPEEMEYQLRHTPFSREEFELSIKPTEDVFEQARRTIVLSFFGYGSDSVTRRHRTGFRTNSNQSGTTPARDWASFPDQVMAFAERLRGVIIENRDAKEVMESQDSEATLHYVDPPYIAATRTGTGTYRFEMDDAAHTDLVDFLLNLKGMVLLSGYAHPIYDRLQNEGWEISFQETLVFTNKRRTEVLWLNPSAIKAQAQTTFKLEGA